MDFREINRPIWFLLFMGLIWMHLLEGKYHHNNHLVFLLLGSAMHENMQAIIRLGMWNMERMILI